MVHYDAINPKHFFECMQKKKIFLFGTGEIGRLALKDKEISDRIIGVVDNSPEHWGKIYEGYVVQSPEILFKTDEVVLITCQYLYDIMEQLEWLKVRYYFHYETLKYIQESGRATEIQGTVLDEEAQQYYGLWDKQAFYAHAMGTIDDIKYTNSREAFVRNYSMGCRVFETDIKKLKDGKVVACHGGKYFQVVMKCRGEQEIPLMENTFNYLNAQGYPEDSVQFQKEKVYGRYEVMFWEDIVTLMEEDKELYFLLDTKGVLKDFFDLIQNLSQEIRGRFIVQLAMDQVEWVGKFRGIGCNIVHLIEDYYCRLQGRHTNNELIEACLKYQIGVLTVGKRRINDNLLILAKKYGIKICAYNQVNTTTTISELMERGVSVFCIDDYKVAEWYKENIEKGE